MEIDFEVCVLETEDTNIVQASATTKKVCLGMKLMNIIMFLGVYKNEM